VSGSKAVRIQEIEGRGAVEEHMVEARDERRERPLR